LNSEPLAGKKSAPLGSSLIDANKRTNQTDTRFPLLTCGQVFVVKPEFVEWIESLQSSQTGSRASHVYCCNCRGLIISHLDDGGRGQICKLGPFMLMVGTQHKRNWRNGRKHSDSAASICVISIELRSSGNQPKQQRQPKTTKAITNRNKAAVAYKRRSEIYLPFHFH
jgi:hypothetical protein